MTQARPRGGERLAPHVRGEQPVAAGAHVHVPAAGEKDVVQHVHAHAEVDEARPPSIRADEDVAGLEVEVHDPQPAQVVQRRGHLDAESGRGIFLMRAMVDELNAFCRQVGAAAVRSCWRQNIRGITGMTDNQPSLTPAPDRRVARLRSEPSAR